MPRVVSASKRKPNELIVRPQLRGDSRPSLSVPPEDLYQYRFPKDLPRPKGPRLTVMQFIKDVASQALLDPDARSAEIFQQGQEICAAARSNGLLTSVDTVIKIILNLRLAESRRRQESQPD